MSLILLLNPKQYGGAAVPDTSDILDVYRRKRRTKAEDLLEEELAAQILRARQKPLEMPAKVKRTELAAKLKSKLNNEDVSQKRKKQIKMLLLLLATDDYD